MTQAGEYPLTVLLQSTSVLEESSLGHERIRFTDVRKCAARLWVRSAAEIASQPADLTSVTLRLLLRMPPRELGFGWGVVYEDRNYEIVTTDARDRDVLVGLDPR